MATFNGTAGANAIGGSDDADLIRGFGGADDLNGAAGNDTIYGGDAADTVAGGEGDDSLFGGAGVDTIMGEDGNDTIDGGDDADADVIDGGAGDDYIVYRTGDVIDGGADEDTLEVALVDGMNVGTLASNIELIAASNVAGLVLDLTSAEDQFFAFDESATSTDFGVDATITLVEDGLDGGTLVVSENAGVLTYDNTSIVINGETLAAGDTFSTTLGSVVVGHDGTNWTLEYTSALTTTINAETTVADDDLTVVVTGNDGTDDVEVSFAVSLDRVIGANVDLTAETTRIRVNGTENANTIITADEGGITHALGGNDVITVAEGNHRVLAGEGNDTVTISGDGNSAIAGGAGTDTIAINGDGNNTAWAGADVDSITITGAGNNRVGGGAGNDTIIVNGDGDNAVFGGDDNDTVTVAGDGANVLGLGEGADTVTISGTGANTVYGGADTDTDTVTVALAATGDNTIYANSVGIAGTGVNTVYTSDEDGDVVGIAATATGANVVYDAAGDDTFNLVSGGNATLVFELGLGNDTINGFAVADDFVLDLSGLGFTSANDVLSNMTQSGADVSLFVTAGQTITLDTVSLTALQAADPADWLIV